MSVKRELVWGTIILTIAGLAARLLGLFNRIYLANLISTAELGRYQLIFPVFMFCMAVSCSGMQVALSKMVSAFHAEGRTREIWTTVRVAVACSLALSLLCMAVIYAAADEIALWILNESDCGTYLRIMSVALPFAAIHTCINGYFYGCRKASVPAAAQLLEQIARVGCIFGLSLWVYGDSQADASIAVWGLAAGESMSCLIAIICYEWKKSRWSWETGNIKNCTYTGDVKDCNGIGKVKIRNGTGTARDCGNRQNAASTVNRRQIFCQLWNYAGMLTLNRVSVTLLQSAEMILLPLMMTRHLGDSVQALELFGILTGIVIPVISFPNTVTNALSTLLLPTVSEAEAAHNYRAIADTFEKSIRYCLMMGVFAVMLFVIYGKEMGGLLFGDEAAGYYIQTFAILCPLMYIQSLLSSTLNGFGKVNETMMHHVIASGLRIAGIVLLVPEMGIPGYMAGLFAANVIVTVIAHVRLGQLADIHLRWGQLLLVPACGAVLSGEISKWAGSFGLPEFLRVILPGGALIWKLFFQCAVMAAAFFGLMLPWLKLKIKKR